MQLHIRVVEAKEVPKMDVFGKADPFCLLQMSSARQIYKTKVIKSTFTPYWDETYHIPVLNPNDDYLAVLMKDADKGSADDPISRLELRMSQLEKDKVADKWYPMTPVEGVKQGGRIRLVTHLAPAGSTPFKPDSGNKIAQSIFSSAASASGLAGFLGVAPVRQDLTNISTSDGQILPPGAPPPGGQSGYPPQAPQYPQNPAYPQQPPPNPAYPQQPPPSPAYPQQPPMPAYPPQNQGYAQTPPPSAGYPQQPPQSAGYPQQPPASQPYPQQPVSGYSPSPQNQGYAQTPPPSAGYPPQAAQYPPFGAPAGYSPQMGYGTPQPYDPSYLQARPGQPDFSRHSLPPNLQNCGMAGAMPGAGGAGYPQPGYQQYPQPGYPSPQGYPQPQAYPGQPQYPGYPQPY